MSKSVAEILNERKIILGPEDRIKSSRLSKYNWAYTLYKDMQNNEWKPSSISLVKDNLKACNEGTQIAVKRALAFLTNLDGIQVENLAYNIVSHVTDYTIQQCLYRQIYEEVNHVDSYATIIETYYDDPREVYLLHEENKILREKNDYILAQANELGHEFSAEKFVYALVSNLLLEGVYFHTGFLDFYAIERYQRQLTGGCEMIQYIQRDETTHLVLFTNMFNTMRLEFPEVFTAKVYNNIEKLFEKATDLEINWGNHIIEKGLPGVSPKNNELYIQDLGNHILCDIGMRNMWDVKNPYPWVKDYTANANKNEKNLFESKSQSYSKKDLDFDF